MTIGHGEKDQAEQELHRALLRARGAPHEPSELVRLSGISKQQLSRLEGGHIRLRLDHLKPFANALGYTPEQMLLWGRYPGTPGAPGGHIESSDVLREESRHDEPLGPAPGQVPELDTRAGLGGGGRRRAKCARTARHADPIKSEGWLFPASFVREQLHAVPARLLVLDTNGDSMAPTIPSGERVIVDTGHKTPTPDGLYAIRDAFGCIVVKRLQLMRSSRADAGENHFRQPERIRAKKSPLNELEIVGKVLCCLKLF